MAKTKNDEIYERGVRDGQTKGGFDHFVQNNTPKTNEDDKIYDKGYQYGASHKPDKTTSRESESISSHDDPRSSSGSDYSSSGGGGGGGGGGAGCMAPIVAFILFGLICKAFTTIFEPKETPRETQREQVIQEETAGDVTRRILDGINPWTGPIQENTYQPRHVGKISFNSDNTGIEKTIISFDNLDMDWSGFSGLELNYNIEITAGEFELVVKIPDNLRESVGERKVNGKVVRYSVDKPLEKIIDSNKDHRLLPMELGEFYDDIEYELKNYLRDMKSGRVSPSEEWLQANSSQRIKILQNNDQLGRELCERYIKKNLFQRSSTTGANYNGGSTGR